MRILLVSHWFPPVVSGSSYYAGSLALALTEAGHEVRVITVDWGKGTTPAEDHPFRVYLVPAIKMPSVRIFYHMDLMGFCFTPPNRRRIRAIIDDYRPDIIHHVNHIFDSTFLSTGAARAKSIPIVGSITTPVQNQRRWRQNIMSFFDRAILGRFGVRRWDGIVNLDSVVTGYVERLYGPEAASRSRVIPFGIPKSSMELYQDTCVERTGPPRIVFIGHIHAFRNPSTLIAAMHRILEEVPDARLDLVGRVGLQEPVQLAGRLGLNEDSVRFRGPLPHEEVVEIMRSAHVFVGWVTGPYPALGTAPREAMLCGTPVVSDIPRDLLGDEVLIPDENIVLVDSSNSLQVGAAVISLLNDESKRRRIGRAGRGLVLEKLSWESIAAAMVEFYGEILLRARRM